MALAETKEVKTVTPEMKDQLIQVFLDEHRKFNGIPRYTTVEGAIDYYEIPYPESVTRTKSEPKAPELKVEPTKVP